MHLRDRLKSGWNAFRNKDPANNYQSGEAYGNVVDIGRGYYSRPDIYRYIRNSHGRTIITAIYNRIAVDVASTQIEHVRLDENGQYLEQINSGLNYCLTQSANVDETGHAMIQNLVESLLDEGTVALVPVDTTTDPTRTGAYDIQSLRVGQVLEWYPQHVKTRIYNEQIGEREDILVEKQMTAIIQNPFYSIMNETYSVLNRLNEKLAMLDVVDQQSSTGRMNMIVQLPYTIKSEARQRQAEARTKKLEEQLENSKYGIGYIDATEHITQLNRSVDNTLLEQIESLTKTLFSQLGMTEEILNGTASEQVMKNYYVRTIDPILDTITTEMRRKFLTKTARSQLQSIEYYRDPFTFTPTGELADIADKFRRNEILTSDEFRSSIGFKPNGSERANTLQNPNIAYPPEQAEPLEIMPDEVEDDTGVPYNTEE